MNNFDFKFFAKYLREDEEIVVVCHRHVINIIDDVLVWMIFGILLPNFFYYFNSLSLQELVPRIYFEIYIGIIYILLMYRVFDWYNDVWILTDKGIIDVDWSLFSQNITFLGYDEINGVEIPDQSFISSLIGKGTIVIHLQNNSAEFALLDAANPSQIASYIQEMIDQSHNESGHHHQESEEIKRPSFDLMVETLSEIVQEHLQKKSKSHFADDFSEEQFQEKISESLSQPGTIDLRRQEILKKGLESHHH